MAKHMAQQIYTNFPLDPTIWLVGPPLRIRFKTMIDNKLIQELNPNEFLNSLLSACKHCHSRKIILGKR